MRSYVEQAVGTWDATEQRQQSDQVCGIDGCSIIVVDDVQAGVLVVRDQPSELYLARLFLLPEFQRQGIGTHLLLQLRARAETECKPLRLRVLVSNPARRLYERIGFRLTHSTSQHHYLEYMPRSR